MKNFEEWWPEQDERVFDLTEDKECCAVTWRVAYETIRNEILNKSRRASHASILGFIDEELDE